MGRASTLGERRKARDGLIKRLAEESLDWINDLPGILGAEWLDNSSTNRPSAATAPASEVNLLDLVVATIEDRVVTSCAKCTVTALWSSNTYVYDNFIFAPQLGILVPASGHGKSTLRKVLEAVVHSSWHSHHATAAVIYRELERNPHTTLMFDEAENQNLTYDGKLRAIIDAAYEHDGCIDLVDRESYPIKFCVFAPVLWALRGSISDVPMSLVSRSFIIAMKKGTPRKRLQKYYFEDPDFVAVRAQAESWAANVQLDLDPEIPAELCGEPRMADNCRPLISIADSLGRGAEARAALIELCGELPNPDVVLQALGDAMKVWASKAEHLFTLGDFDRISKKALAIGMIEQNPFWDSWRGRNDKKQPHPLQPVELGGLLRIVGVFSKTVWPVPRTPKSTSAPGYYLSQFEKACKEHSTKHDTPTQASKIIRLPKH